MKKYKIEFVVQADMLSVIVELLTGEVGRLAISEYRSDSNSPVKEEKRTRFVKPYGKPLSEQLTSKTVLDLLKSEKKPVHLKDIGEAMVKAGFSVSSASPTISRLTHGGLTRQVSSGTYELVERKEK